MGAVPELRETWALNIASLQRFQYVGGPIFNAMYTVSEPVVMLSDNPVLLDSIMRERINEHRKRMGLPIARGFEDIGLFRTARSGTNGYEFRESGFDQLASNAHRNLNSYISSLTKIEVTTARESYPIYIGRQLQNALGDEIANLKSQGVRLAVVTDTAIRQAIPQYFSGVFEGIPTIGVQPGETSKSLSEFGRVLDFFASIGLDRGGVVVAFGGGVVGDLTGFAAASWLRGVRFIQVPTTLLSMVDSSVGGKTGINIDSGKNMVGAFHQPISVYEDLDLLASLPPREFAAGMAEVVKYGMLGDSELFDMLEASPLQDSRDERLAGVVKRNCQLKADFVNADEKELAGSGGRALLNLGHTFGHAIENVAGYGDYLHGKRFRSALSLLQI